MLTPNLVADDGSLSRNIPRRSMGDQTASPYMACEDELTMIPKKLTMEKAKGTDISCGRTTSDGCFARDAKSGALL